LTTAIPVSVPTKSVRVGILSSINKLDPRDAVESVSSLVLSQIFETPYGYVAGQSGAVPLLFEPLKAEDGSGSLFSASVRKGISFSDGTPLDAELAARSLRGASVLAQQARIDVRGDRVWFKLATPNPRFELTLTHSGCSIVLDKAAQFHGTGPYMFDRRPNLRTLQTAPRIRLVRNPHSRVAASVGEVEFIVLPAEADGAPRRMVEALRDGAIDLTTSLTIGDISAHQLVGVAPVTQPGNSTAVLYFNTERRLLAKSEARRGIAYALDLHEIASRCNERNPAAFVASNILPPSMGRMPVAQTESRSDALRMIESSGLRGTRQTLLVPWAPRPYLLKPLPVAQAIQAQLEKAGITVLLTETRSGDEFFDALNSGRFDLALSGWIADTPDPADFYEAMLWSKYLAGGDNHANNSRWNHPPTDAALNQFRGEPTERNRAEIQRILTTEMPFFPLVYGHATVVHSRKLRNVSISPVGFLPLASLTM
jgi:peptide/nickel transport system substrate-binding protein